jgi:hypothetical protein
MLILIPTVGLAFGQMIEMIFHAFRKDDDDDAVLAEFGPRGAIHQLLNIILKLRILVLLLVSAMPYVLKVKNYYLIGE